MTTETTTRPTDATLRWSARAHSIPEIENELIRIWEKQDMTVQVEGETERHAAARTNVMNLIVVARRPEAAEKCAATVQALTGRHPSRTVVIQSADPDGPSWLDARIEAHCVMPREDGPETCAETIFVTCGGEAGRHLSAIATPLIIHDLPVTVWWPGEPPLTSPAAHDLLAGADRLVVDGSTWSGDGLGRLGEMAAIAETAQLAISDFALVRQSRWREAIASIFDDPDFLPYLRSLRRIAVTYATHDETGAPGSTNLVKPVYHVGWLASRLGLSVVRPLAPVAVGRAAAAGAGRPGRAAVGKQAVGRGLAATLSDGRGEVAVVVRPVVSTMPSGTTLRVELLAERRGSELRADVTAEAETVHVRVWQDGVEALDRHFRAPRRTDSDLLTEAVESGRRDSVSVGALRSAAELVRPIGGTGVSGPEIVVGVDPAACTTTAADRIASALHRAVGERGRADWATTGGSSIGLYRRLADEEMAGAVPWADIHVWWGDDRFVPRDHPLSNVKPFDDILLGAGQAEEGTAGGPAGVPIPLDQVHAFPTGEAIGRGLGAAWCATTLAATLSDAGLETADGWPVFDLVLLGIGRDGHLLSVFAGSSAFDAAELGLAIPAPTHIEPHVERVTLNPAIIAAARSVLVVAFGSDKAPVIADILEGDRDPRELPARLAVRDGATWILDEAAAARLSR